LFLTLEMATVPGVPQIFRQPLASDQTLEFAWQGPLSDGGSPITGYRLTITPEGGSPTVRIISNPDAIYWKETGLLNNTWYEISLEAGNAIGYGDAIFFRSFQPGSKPDYPPSTANAVALSPGSVLVSWTAPSILPDATIYWYAVYARSSNPADPEISAGGDGQTETSIVIDGLNPASSYYFEVYAVNCPGYSPVAITGTINWNILNANWAASILGEGFIAGVNSNLSSFSNVGYNIAKDQHNNMYVVLSGSTSGTAGFQNIKNLDGSASSVFTSPRVGLYLVKYNPSGIAQWAAGFGVPTSTPIPGQIAFDSMNNIYITGRYVNTSITTLLDASGNTQINSTITLPTTVNASVSNMFLIKYNPSGVTQWATALKCNNTVNGTTGNSIQIDSSDNLYIIGDYRQDAINVSILDASGNGQVNSTIILPPVNSPRGYIIKYNINGISQWTTYIPSVGSSSILKVLLDASSNLYVTGVYSSGTNFTLLDASGNGQIISSLGITLPASSATLAIFLIKYNSNGVAQWATYFLSGGNSQGSSLILDSNMNIYLVGYYNISTTVTLQDVSGSGQTASSITLPDASGVGINVCLVKYNTAGIVQWATYIRGTGNDIGRDIAIDSSDNVYITGDYTSTAQITLQDASGNGQAASSITIPSATGEVSNVFLVKYNSNGITQWATYIAGNLTDQGFSIFIDSSNRIYITGLYVSTSTVILKDASGNGQINSSFTMPSTFSFASLYIVEYTASGTVIQRTYYPTFGKTTTFLNAGNQMRVDSSGNIYICGNFENLYSNDPIVLRNADGTNSSVSLPITTGAILPYLIKFNSAGIIQWATNLTSNTSAQNYSIITDASNNVYICGVYTLAISINDASGNGQVASSVTLPTTSASNNFDMFLIKYNPNGICQWATHANGTASDLPTSLNVDSSNNVYLTGRYNSVTTLILKDVSGNGQVNSTITLPSTSSTNDMWLVKYNSNGICQWATYFRGVSGTDVGNTIAIDASNNIYVAGQYLNTSVTTLKDASGNGQVDSTITLRATGPTTSHAFLLKYTSDGIVQWATSFGDSTGTTYQPTGLAIDSSGAVYVTGLYTNTSVSVTLRDASGNTSSASTIQLPITVAADMFFIKYNSSGTVQWATCFSGSSNDGGRSIAIDSSNNAFVTGNYRTTSIVTLKDASGNGQVNSTKTLPNGSGNAANIQGFMIKYDSNGIVQYAVSFSGDTIATRMSFGMTAQIYGSYLYLHGVFACPVSPLIPQTINYTGDVADSTQVSLPVSTNSMFLIQYEFE
jgi:hypothetical protein